VNKQLFEQVLDQTAIKWFVGTDRPTITGDKAGKFKSRPAEEGGYPQVIKFKPITEFCTDCCKSVKDRVKTINIRDGGYRCSCGVTFPEKCSVSNTGLNETNK
jgi:hypothetical protein